MYSPPGCIISSENSGFRRSPWGARRARARYMASPTLKDDGGRLRRPLRACRSAYRSADCVDNLEYMEPSSASPTLIGERAKMSEEDRVERLNALWDRLMDPDGFDREALKHIEQLDERDD